MAFINTVINTDNLKVIDNFFLNWKNINMCFLGGFLTWVLKQRIDPSARPCV